MRAISHRMARSLSVWAQPTQRRSQWARPRTLRQRFDFDNGALHARLIAARHDHDANWRPSAHDVIHLNNLSRNCHSVIKECPRLVHSENHLNHESIVFRIDPAQVL
jgi:hypothetical protein